MIPVMLNAAPNAHKTTPQAGARHQSREIEGMQRAVTSIAGTDSRRFLAFKEQTEAFHEKWRQYFSPRILESRAMTVRDPSSLPRWHWIEMPASEIRWSIWWRAMLVLALASVLGGLALARLSRRPIG
jgi:ABC-2 type transport system permease protein